jgi:hypothetical protein
VSAEGYSQHQRTAVEDIERRGGRETVPKTNDWHVCIDVDTPRAEGWVRSTSPGLLSGECKAAT